MGTEVRQTECGKGFERLLERCPGADREAALRTAAVYPARINTYYGNLVKSPGDPLWRQAVPDSAELDDSGSSDDPLAEEQYSPVPGLVHRYPDRVLFLVSDSCPVYCRFCTRKRLHNRQRNRVQLLLDREAGLAYIRKTRSIRDVLLSGGDPLMLSDSELLDILDRLFSIDRLDLVRIGSRMLCTDPGRITHSLARGLGGYRALYINTHFNHPAELSKDSVAAAVLLADAGIPLACQTVLLRGVNDDPDLLEELFRGLLRMRIRPYYLHIMDHTRGTAHFRLSLSRIYAIYSELQRRLGGMALPRLMMDIPGGGGKIVLDPHNPPVPLAGGWRVRGYSGSEFFYPEAEDG